eukprot:TRINITY_DN8044_c0_g1_i1.p1 TRINITY_DN8044_c0_g1~~TRINITY_DN8044_c0_g1_i1.p1  ORF type:complete len:136 (-),score=47.76 TRINITY_DN8044_c0_g1_i1:144-551(-)
MAEELKQKFSEIQQKKAGKKEDIQIDEFEWIKLNQELAINRESGKKHQESGNEKLMRKFKENPLIPIGCLLTTGFLVNGLFKFARRDMAASQTMMRGRIAAQGFTIFALLGGVAAQVKQKTWVKPGVKKEEGPGE